MLAGQPIGEDGQRRMICRRKLRPGDADRQRKVVAQLDDRLCRFRLGGDAFRAHDLCHHSIA